MISDIERALLLRIARDAIAGHVGRQSAIGRPPWREALWRGPAGARVQPEERAEPGQQSAVVEGGALAERRAGVFVTIHHSGRLRGCIGRIEADEPLPRSVARCAVAACSEDPRFVAVTAAELGLLQVEVSLLGPMERADGPPDIEVGRHGLMIEMGRRRGLLLPQVAIERRWDAPTFLAQTCRKAGLTADSWQRGALVWRFEADVFGDELAY